MIRHPLASPRPTEGKKNKRRDIWQYTLGPAASKETKDRAEPAGFRLEPKSGHDALKGRHRTEPACKLREDVYHLETIDLQTIQTEKYKFIYFKITTKEPHFSRKAQCGHSSGIGPLNAPPSRDHHRPRAPGSGETPRALNIFLFYRLEIIPLKKGCKPNREIL